MRLTGAGAPTIKPRNESSGRQGNAQYYYRSGKGSDAPLALTKGPREASGHGPSRAFFIARGRVRVTTKRVTTMTREMTGAEMVMEALADQGVKHLFGYPGGAVLPIYDALFAQKKVQHILVRHEQGAVHAAEGYARSTGKVGCVLVTSGPGATNAVTGLTDALCASILMGRGAFPASDPQWLGMLGMHGTWEANWAMHDCDLMICIGARFDDRITGRLDAFSPGSTKIHVDIDPSSINKNVKVDVPIIGDCAHVIEDMLKLWRDGKAQPDQKAALGGWWKEIAVWRAKKSLSYRKSADIIKPQY